MAGMELALPLNGTLTVAGRITSVEYVDVSHERRTYIGLAIGYENAEELAFWSAINISGEILALALRNDP